MGVTSFLLVSCLGLTIIAHGLACNAPSSIVDGSYSPISSNYIYGDMVQYRCNEGFTLHGSNTRACSNSGTFYPDAPTCVSDEPPIEYWAIIVGVSGMCVIVVFLVFGFSISIFVFIYIKVH